SDGTLYVSTGQAASTGNSRSNAVVALDPKTLAEKDYLAAATPFTTAPVAFAMNGKEFVAAGNADGRVYVLESASLGGADHRTPLAISLVSEGGIIRGIATVDDGGTRWLLVSIDRGTNGAIVGMKVDAASGATAASWSSRNIVSPATAAAANGVVFGVSAGPSN